MTTMPKGGGAQREVASARQGVGHSATDGKHVYWTAPGGILFRAPKTGGCGAGAGVERWPWPALVSAVARCRVCLLGERRADKTRIDHIGQVMRVAKAGGPVTVIASEQQGIADVVVDEEHVFWATQDGVWRWSKTTEKTDHFVDAQIPGRPPYGLALDDQYLYWSDASAVQRSPTLNGGTPETVSSSGHGGVLLGGGYLYLVTEKALVRVPKAGGTATTVATWAGWDNGPTNLAVDESGIYWAVNSQSRGSASVIELAK